MPNSAVELLKRAQKVHDALRADPAFLHANEESRGIIVPNLGEAIAELAVSLVSTSDFIPLEVIRRAAAVVNAASDLDSSYIRTRGGTGAVDIDIRGDTGPVDFESMDMDKLARVERRRSGIDIFLRPDGVDLDVHTAFMTTYDGREADDVILPLIKTLSREQVAVIAGGLLDIVEAEVLRVINS